jgi:hypothetical protein
LFSTSFERIDFSDSHPVMWNIALQSAIKLGRRRNESCKAVSYQSACFWIQTF